MWNLKGANLQILFFKKSMPWPKSGITQNARWEFPDKGIAMELVVCRTFDHGIA